MFRLISAPVLVLTLLLVSLAPSGASAGASGGNVTAQTVNMYREDCTANAAGLTVGTARFSLDDQGGNPGGIEVRTGITAGLPRASYSLFLLANPCQVLTNLGTLRTDDSGRGDLDVHVAASLLPPGAALRVQAVAPGSVLTSDPVNGL